MKHLDYFYNCSRQYLDGIDGSLYDEISEAIRRMPKRDKQAEINNDLFWLLAECGWHYDTLGGITDAPPEGLPVRRNNRVEIAKDNARSLCVTTTTIGADWHSDFAKMCGGDLIQLEVQFGKVEAMFKDFCGFRMARYEKRLALGIEIIMCDPAKYFAHRKGAVSGMAYFDIAKKSLPAIGLDCPIWLVGIDI